MEKYKKFEDKILLSSQEVASKIHCIWWWSPEKRLLRSGHDYNSYLSNVLLPLSLHPVLKWCFSQNQHQMISSPGLTRSRTSIQHLNDWCEDSTQCAWCSPCQWLPALELNSVDVTLNHIQPDSMVPQDLQFNAISNSRSSVGFT